MRKKRTLEERLMVLEIKREQNVNRYIIPIEIKIVELRDKIELKEKKEILKYRVNSNK